LDRRETTSRWHPILARRIAIALAVAMGCAALSIRAGATTVLPLDDVELVRRADAIVVGHARSAGSVWVGSKLYTRYRIEVQEQWLGAAITQLQVMVPGGIDRNRARPIAVSVAGAP
jgi:hypothetical protein